MDIWAVKCGTALALAFFPIWLIAAIGAITLVLRQPSWKDERNRFRPPRLFVVLATAVGIYMFLLGSDALTCMFAVARRFESLVSRPPDVAVIRSNHGDLTLPGPEVAELLRIIDDGQEVWGHHSHPTDEVQLSFPEIGYVYELGRDSERAKEFWLTWVGYPGSGEPRYLFQVRQFHSDELHKWLERHGGGAD